MRILDFAGVLDRIIGSNMSSWMSRRQRVWFAVGDTKTKRELGEVSDVWYQYDS